MPNDPRRLTPLDLRHLEAYLAEERRERGVRGFLFSESGRALLAVTLFSLGALFFMKYLGCFVFVVVMGVGQAFIQLVLSGLEMLLNRKRPRNPQREKAREAVEELRKYCEQGVLPRRIHPAVAHALEACAASRDRVRQVLASPNWKEGKVDRHWKELEQASLSAADEAMDEAALLALPAVRRHGQRKAPFEAMIVEDPEASAIVDPLREVEGRLRKLAEGLEGAVGGRTLPGESIERALEQLQTIQQAEAELDHVDHRG